MPKVAKALMSMFAEDNQWDEQVAKARELHDEQAVHEQVRLSWIDKCGARRDLTASSTRYSVIGLRHRQDIHFLTMMQVGTIAVVNTMKVHREFYECTS